MDFIARYKGKCVVLEVKANSGKTTSLRTALKNKNVYHLNNAIKLGQCNVGRDGEVLTAPQLACGKPLLTSRIATTKGATFPQAGKTIRTML